MDADNKRHDDWSKDLCVDGESFSVLSTGTVKFDGELGKWIIQLEYFVVPEKTSTIPRRFYAVALYKGECTGFTRNEINQLKSKKEGEDYFRYALKQLQTYGPNFKKWDSATDKKA